MNAKRLDYMDMAKGIGIILVVLGHSTLIPDGLLTWIASFHMPLFFIVSGMLIRHTGEENKETGIIWKRKLKAIMIPYVSFSLIYLVIDLLYLWLKPGSITLAGVGSRALDAVTLNGISVLWFLPALFFGECLFLLLRKHRNHVWTVGIGVVLAIAVSILQPLFKEFYPAQKNIPIMLLGYLITLVFRCGIAIAFLTFGYYIHPFLQKKRQKGELRSGQIKELLLAAGFMLLNIAVSFQNGRVDLNTLSFSHPVLYFSGAFSGSLAVILLCKNIKACRPLAYLGINSLIIMVTHLDGRVMITAINTANWINQFVTRAKVYVLYLNIAIVVTLLELLLIYIINHYLCFLIGKKRPKNRGKLKIYK